MLSGLLLAMLNSPSSGGNAEPMGLLLSLTAGGGGIPPTNGTPMGLLLALTDVPAATHGTPLGLLLSLAF
jgi:hypothetical protein